MSEEERGLWLVTGKCEFDIKPCQIHSFMKYFGGIFYDPSTGFSPWDI